MHRSGREEVKVGDKCLVVLVQQSSALVSELLSPPWFTSKRLVQNTSPARKLGILELQSHSWPSEKPPSLTLRSSARESDASRPKSYKSATGLELLESRAVMQSFGNHRLRCSKTRLAVPVVPPISLALKNAMCRLSERENISLARRFQQQVLDILLTIKIENTVWWWWFPVSSELSVPHTIFSQSLTWIFLTAGQACSFFFNQQNHEE